MNDFKKKIRKKLIDLNFDFVGFTEPIVDNKSSKELKKFLDKNHYGEMKWLKKHYEKKINPRLIWNEVKTVVVLGVNYCPNSNPLYKNKINDIANISVYATNKDYHKIIFEKLKFFQKWLKLNHKIESKIFVDTAPIMEKYFAKKTGIGWQGKHTNIVSKNFGSWLFLSEIFLPVKVNIDLPSIDNCGSCNDCKKICPTDALKDDYKIEARKCISYLTIEYKGPVPKSLRKKIGNKIYGCDDCLAVCPWNKFSEATENQNFLSTDNHKKLSYFLNFNKSKFNEYFKDSPIKRIGWITFLRNVILATGNSKSKIFITKLKSFWITKIQ